MRRSLPLLAAGAGLVLLGTANAQVLKGHNTSAPVDFSADRIEVQDRADRVVVSGNVQVTQAGLTLTAQRLTVAYHDAKGIEIDRLDASGGVVVTRGDERASGSVAIYDLNRRLITLLGGVQLSQGANRLAGSRLVIDLATGRSTVDGSAASGPSGTSTSSNGRVSGTFKVRQRPN
ncbi:LptA/OstA family protein [Sphingobium nicotianae]|uniref:OstA family protein n=1 Tax=Sphingobium nicotianae TaxID=2782607 RepID=A0A9X1IQ09_9SPHN|nr:LptA/OstA family protein [Sphingobium nicotianae]MBT2186402.1 OstA family protein [Sphingobium nicotianae]